MVDGFVVRLIRERLVVEIVTQNAQTKDGYSEGIAASVGATKDFGEKASVIFCGLLVINIIKRRFRPSVGCNRLPYLFEQQYCSQLISHVLIHIYD